MTAAIKLSRGFELHHFLVNKFDFEIINPNDTKPRDYHLNMKYSGGISPDDKHQVHLIFRLTVTTKDNNLRISGIFNALFIFDDDVPENFKELPLFVNGLPAVIFPYIRSYITTVTVNAGIIPPVFLPPIDFATEGMEVLESSQF